jgi:tRNA (cmo5U34)-methyltransferase
MINHFDQAAQHWDANPERRALAQAVVAEIRQEISLTSAMQVLDFGAGTGLISFELATYAGRVYALDPSSGMIEELRRKCKQSGIENIVPIHAADLSQAEIPNQVDLVVSCMVMHHIQDVPGTLKQLHAQIKSGGLLAIADLMPDQGEFHDKTMEVHHNGFNPAELSTTLRQAGFLPGESKIVYKVLKERPFPVFLLIATRP